MKTIGPKHSGSSISKSRGISMMNFMETFGEPMSEFAKKRWLKSKLKKNKKKK